MHGVRVRCLRRHSELVLKEFSPKLSPCCFGLASGFVVKSPIMLVVCKEAFIFDAASFETPHCSPHLVTRDGVLCCHELQLLFCVGKDLPRRRKRCDMMVERRHVKLHVSLVSWCSCLHRGRRVSLPLAESRPKEIGICFQNREQISLMVVYSQVSG